MCGEGELAKLLSDREGRIRIFDLFVHGDRQCALKGASHSGLGICTYHHERAIALETIRYSLQMLVEFRYEKGTALCLAGARERAVLKVRA